MFGRGRYVFRVLLFPQQLNVRINNLETQVAFATIYSRNANNTKQNTPPKKKSKPPPKKKKIKNKQTNKHKPINKNKKQKQINNSNRENK